MNTFRSTALCVVVIAIVGCDQGQPKSTVVSNNTPASEPSPFTPHSDELSTPAPQLTPTAEPNNPALSTIDNPPSEVSHLPDLEPFFLDTNGINFTLLKKNNWREFPPELLRRFAQQGLGHAQTFLAERYRDGDGVPQDYAEAYAWFSVAAKSGDEMAIQARDEVKTKIDPKLLGQAESRAAEYIKRFNHPTIILKNNVKPPSSDDMLPELPYLPTFPDSSSVDFPLTIKVVSPASSSEHTAGEKIEFTFAITNDSEEDYLISEIDFGKAKAHSVGTIQRWVERLGPVQEIPVIPAITAKYKHLYAAGGNTMISRKSVLKPGENESVKSSKLDTTGYPSGQYRYHIVLSTEFKPMATTAVDFSIK